MMKEDGMTGIENQIGGAWPGRAAITGTILSRSRTNVPPPTTSFVKGNHA